MPAVENDLVTVSNESCARLNPEAPYNNLGIWCLRALIAKVTVMSWIHVVISSSMGGDVTVDSALGQGARFVFTLPYRGD